MSFTRLLYVGKSVKALSNRPPEYKLAAQNFFPNFTALAKPNIHSPTSEGLVSGETGNVESEPQTVINAQNPNSSGPEPESRPGPIPFEPLAKQIKSEPPIKRRFVLRNPFAKRSAEDSEAPVQIELALNSIQVLRNDLTEADVEVVRPVAVRPAIVNKARNNSRSDQPWLRRLAARWMESNRARI